MSSKKKRPKFTYSQEQVLQALDAVRKGETVNSASKRFGIPQSTLALQVSGKTPLIQIMGPKPILRYNIEEMLVNWIKALADRGFPVTKVDILVSVNQLVKDMNFQDKTKNGQLGEKWFTLFMQRRPDLSERKPEKLSKIRADVSEQNVREWFKEVSTYLESIDCSDVLKDPKRIFNLDESAFWICPKTGKVICREGKKNVYEVHTGNDKENVTILCDVNASGKVAPTLAVYPGQRFLSSTRLKFPDDWSLARSESGWMNAEIFMNILLTNF